MPLLPRLNFAPLPVLPDPDPAKANEFAALAAELLPPVDTADVTTGGDLASLHAAVSGAVVASASLGGAIAAGATELAAMVNESAADTLAPEIAAAVQQDTALLSAQSDLAATVAKLP